MEIQIRKPLITELNELLDLWVKEYDFHHKLDPVYYVDTSENNLAQFKSYLGKAILEQEPNILIAVNESRIIGFITFNKGRNEYIDSNIKEFGEIIELFVESEFRSKGIGSQLMQAAEKYFKQAGLSFIKIQASTLNENALQFYKNLKYINSQALLIKPI
jgi:ribosomal protein S18 acetylase RimI-like enzyme